MEECVTEPDYIMVDQEPGTEYNLQSPITGDLPPPARSHLPKVSRTSRVAPQTGNQEFKL